MVDMRPRAPYSSQHPLHLTRTDPPSVALPLEPSNAAPISGMPHSLQTSEHLADGLANQANSSNTCYASTDPGRPGEGAQGPPVFPCIFVVLSVDEGSSFEGTL